MSDEACSWKEDEDGTYATDCGEEFMFIDGTPTENLVKFCCYCGRPCLDVPYKEEE